MVKKYIYDINNATNYILFEEKLFTYYDSNNPWKGIIYPALLCHSLPNSKFISINIVKAETNNTSTTNFSYLYDEKNLTIKGIGQYHYSSARNYYNILDEFTHI